MTHANQNTAGAVLALPSHSDHEAWERAFEAIPGVSRIPENDFTQLQQLLAPCDDKDSYLTSPMYYAFTGRRGLWTYQKDDAFILICEHPNVDGQILIFPQLLKADTDLIADLLTVMPKPPAGMRIARAKQDETGEQSDIHSDSRHVALIRCEENVLDWKYPVRILSTDDVASLSGHKFMKVRNHIRQLQKRSVEVLPFDAISHSRALERLLHRWANYNATNREEYNLLYAPYENLFSQSIEKPPGLAGLMTFVNGEMEAVSLWDISNHQRPTANVYVNFCNTEIRGLSEFSMVKCCETLRDEGIRFLNLGGSETESLDSYKKKFDPAFSIDLCSIDIKINDDFQYALKRTVNPSARRRLSISAASNV